MICAVDTSNIFFITYSNFLRSLREQNNDNDYEIQQSDLGLFYHLFIKKVLSILLLYPKCIFCFEGVKSTAWRKAIYPEYKSNRTNDRKFVSELIEGCKDFLSNFNTQILEVENCEADDCIYQVCKYYAERNDDIVIISTDRDLSQIINYYPNHVKQISPISNNYIEANPNILLEKAIVGDASDNIKLFKGIGPRTFEKMMENKELFNRKMTPENVQKVNEILQIIDLRLFPQEYQDHILEELKKPFNSINNDKIKDFFQKYKLESCAKEWETSWFN